ncbi:hypothetical protein LCGC14_1067120 [marine sediment metagenome]|uniref:Methyl-accepting transducer domain-containing protein n=1 Tax=marine sediment metagenome TaxID=412755 RepID=A0A0F9Q2F2_9ZZZZ|nr:hypothetical protein [Methylophaga aminisulfidivorans]
MNTMLDTRDTVEQHQVDGLKEAINGLIPMLKKMRLLASNAVSAAARAGSEGDAFRVLTQGIQELSVEIKHEIDASHQFLNELETAANSTERKQILRNIDGVLGQLPLSVSKGDYLAIYCSVEAAHADNHAERFNAVALMLKELIADLRQQISHQKSLLSEMMET